MVSAINYEPRGVPLEVCGGMNAQTSRFCQLNIMSDLSNQYAIPARVCIFHALYDCVSIHLSTSSFNDSQIYL